MLSEDAVARHQVVREMVERAYPDCRVTGITEDAETQAIETVGGADHGLVIVRIADRVRARGRMPGDPSVRCSIVLARDGNLRISETTIAPGGDA